MSTPWYFHVPFCPKICHYCDFAVLKAPERLQKDWLLGMQSELTSKLRQYPDAIKAKTIYMGGGTPSILTQDIMSEWVDTLKNMLEIDEGAEWTIEVNPEHIEQSTLDFYKSLGFNRISIGIQSLNAQNLKVLGRAHDDHVARRALKLLHKGSWNFSADLMFCLPDQKPEGFIKDLSELSEFQPKHISFYGLTAEPQTLFAQQLQKGRLNQPEDLYEEMYLVGVEFLHKKGWERYEISNFAQSGFESKHNSLYWSHQNYLACGPGAHSFWGNERFWNERHFKKWLIQIDEVYRANQIDQVEKNINDDQKVLSEILDIKTLTFEKIWLGLRRREGIPREWLSQEIIDLWLSQGRAQCLNDRIFLAGSGWIYLDEMVLDL